MTDVNRTATNRRIVLASRPHGEPKPENFRLEEVPVPEPGPGQVLLRTRWLSLDPYMRGRMSDAKSYAAPVEIGAPITAETVGEVVASQHPDFAVGDLLTAFAGWQAYLRHGWQGLAPGRSVGRPALHGARRARDAGHDRLYRAARHRPAETGRDRGGGRRRRPGRFAGRADRQAEGRPRGRDRGRPGQVPLRTEELGFDAAVDHRGADLPGALAAACPKGIDVYFENVGGAVFAAVMPLLNPFARIPVCGLVSAYNATEVPTGPDRLPGLMRAVLTNRLHIQGFIVWDFAEPGRDVPARGR